MMRANPALLQHKHLKSQALQLSHLHQRAVLAPAVGVGNLAAAACFLSAVALFRPTMVLVNTTLNKKMAMTLATMINSRRFMARVFTASILAACWAQRGEHKPDTPNPMPEKQALAKGGNRRGIW
jgi:hypothetical protein